MPFVDRADELALLEQWWRQPQAALASLWGRRRVGKTALLSEFAQHKRTVFHTGAGRPVPDELAILSRAARDAVSLAFRDLAARPFGSWDDALETLAEAAREDPLLVVLDEFPEAVKTAPELPGQLRAFWDRARSNTKLKILLCGSAIRTMQAMQEERSPLYGRIDASILLQPFRPYEAAELLAELAPSERALVWGVCGGVPLYLTWWDQTEGVRENLERLVCTPGGLLLNEGLLVLATEDDVPGLAEQVLRAIAAGRTKHNEIEQAVRADPARTLERLIQLRLVERMVPVTEDARRTRLRLYRIADNFLAFWLSIVDKYKTEIDRGLGESILSVLVQELDDHMGARWEDAFREHLRRLAAHGELAQDIVAIDRFWRADGSSELDAVALAGRSREAVLVGEAKWTHRVSGRRIKAALEEKARSLPAVREPLNFAVAAREAVDDPEDVLAITAAEIFA